jgi:Family of unknown function (DUF6348)
VNPSDASETGFGEPARLADERILEIVGESLTQMSGQAWTLQPGPLLKGPGSTGVRIGAPHDGSFRHVDLEFLLSVDHHEETSLINCGTGRFPDPEEAIRDAVESWRATTATVALEMLTRQGKYASHLGPGDAAGFPGWHAIVGEVVGWGFGEESRAKQEWFAEAHPWTELAPLLHDSLDRPALNGIRLMLGQGGAAQTAEVRVNGRLHAPAAMALAAMDWPRTERMNVAHLFLLLVHPHVAAEVVSSNPAGQL